MTLEEQLKLPLTFERRSAPSDKYIQKIIDQNSTFLKNYRNPEAEVRKTLDLLSQVKECKSGIFFRYNTKRNYENTLYVQMGWAQVLGGEYNIKSSYHLLELTKEGNQVLKVWEDIVGSYVSRQLKTLKKRREKSRKLMKQRKENPNQAYSLT